MKIVRLLITENGLEVLKAFAEENYLGNYIACNENEAYYKNIINFPDLLLQLKDDIVLFARNDISIEDEFVWEESLSDMKNKNATYYSFILDTETKLVKEFSNESGKVKMPFASLDTFDKINKIEILIDENLEEQDLEM